MHPWADAIAAIAAHTAENGLCCSIS